MDFYIYTISIDVQRDPIRYQQFVGTSVGILASGKSDTNNLWGSMQKLAATAVKQAKPKAKPYKMTDGGGLYLLVKPQGKYWRYNYRFTASLTGSVFSS